MRNDVEVLMITLKSETSLLTCCTVLPTLARPAGPLQASDFGVADPFEILGRDTEPVRILETSKRT